MKFTKLYEKEQELLSKTNRMANLLVYCHLKDKYAYFKSECYDLERCMAEYLDMSEKTIKRAINDLKEVGLISTTKRGKVNIYSFPVLDEIEGGKPTINKSSIIEQEENQMEKEINNIEPQQEEDTQGNEEVNPIQDLINNDDEFYNVFKNCTDAIAVDRVEKNDKTIRSAQMAKVKLENLFREYNLKYDTQFIEEEIKDKVNSINEIKQYNAA